MSCCAAFLGFQALASVDRLPLVASRASVPEATEILNIPGRSE